MALLRNMAMSRFKEPTALISFKGDVSQEVVNAISLICYVVQRKRGKEPDLLDQHIKRGKFGFTISHSLLKAFSRSRGGDVRGLYRAFAELKYNDFAWNFFQQDKTFPSNILDRNMVIGLGVNLPKGEEEEYLAYLTEKGRRDKKSLVGVSKRKPRQNGLYVEIHPVFEERIVDPDVYAMLDILMIVACSDGKYFYQFYKLVANAWSTGHETLDTRWQDFRDSLHIKEGQYEDYISFKKRVLKPCIDFCNKNSPFRVDPKVEIISRVNRKADKIRLKLSEQQWQPSLFDTYPDEAEALLTFLKEESGIAEIEGEKRGVAEILRDANLEIPKAEADFIKKVQSYKTEGKDPASKKVIREAVQAHGLEGAEEILVYGLAQIAKKEKGDHGAYLATCFREGLGTKSPEQREAEVKKKADLKTRREQEKAEQELEAYSKEFDQLLREKTENAFNTLREAEQEERLEEFRPTQTSSMQRAHAKKGMEHAGFKMMFFSWYRKQFLTEAEQDFIGWMKAEKGRAVEKVGDKYLFKK